MRSAGAASAHQYPSNRVLGWTGHELPVIGLGTWTIEQAQRDLAVEALRTGIEAGMTLVDTAEMYGNGVAEEIVGDAIHGLRDRVFIVSKVLPSNASYDGTLRACERSLKRLRTDVIDLYLLHWRSSYPLRETMRAMEMLVARGQVRYIGVSNFDLEELREAERALESQRLACNQVLYYLKDRGIERRLLPYCRERDIAVIGYSPFGHSDFPKANTAGGRILSEVARRHNKTARQVALNFLVRHGVFSIPKSADPRHVLENSGATGWDLTPEEYEIIDRTFPAPDHDVPLGII